MQFLEMQTLKVELLAQSSNLSETVGEHQEQWAQMFLYVSLRGFFYLKKSYLWNVLGISFEDVIFEVKFLAIFYGCCCPYYAPPPRGPKSRGVAPIGATRGLH